MKCHRAHFLLSQRAPVESDFVDDTLEEIERTILVGAGADAHRAEAEGDAFNGRFGVPMKLIGRIDLRSIDEHRDPSVRREGRRDMREDSHRNHRVGYLHELREFARTVQREHESFALLVDQRPTRPGIIAGIILRDDGSSTGAALRLDPGRDRDFPGDGQRRRVGNVNEVLNPVEMKSVSHHSGCIRAMLHDAVIRSVRVARSAIIGRPPAHQTVGDRRRARRRGLDFSC